MLDADTLAGIARRWCWTTAVERDDLVQEARLALLEAEAAGRLPAEPTHRRAYEHVRARGAMRDLAAREARAASCEVPADDLTDERPGPEQIVAARESLALVKRRLPPWKARALEALLAGQDHDESAISHGLAAARRVLGARHRSFG